MLKNQAMFPRAALCVLALLGSPAFLHARIDLGASHTLGPNDYRAVSAFVTIAPAGGFYVEPSFSLVESGGTSGNSVQRGYGADLGYDGERYTAWVNGGFVPPVMDTLGSRYLNHSLGGGFTMPLGDWGDDQAIRTELGLGALHTRHKERTPTLLGPLRPGKELTTGQTDFFVRPGLRAAGVNLGVQYSNSFYDTDIPVRPRLAQKALDRGANPAIFGFPNYRWGANLSYDRLPTVIPSLGFHCTSFMVEQAPERVYRAGLSFGLWSATLQGTYELVDSGGTSGKRGYFSLGLSAGFGGQG